MVTLAVLLLPSMVIARISPSRTIRFDWFRWTTLFGAWRRILKIAGASSTQDVTCWRCSGIGSRWNKWRSAFSPVQGYVHTALIKRTEYERVRRSDKLPGMFEAGTIPSLYCDSKPWKSHAHGCRCRYRTPHSAAHSGQQYNDVPHVAVSNERPPLFMILWVIPVKPSWWCWILGP
jgi:hypothetical protein